MSKSLTSKKERLKSILKKALKYAGLYKAVVYVYCRGEDIYVKGKDTLHYLCSPFINVSFKRRNVADGLPFPPVRLVYTVTNTYRNEWFYETGVVGAQCIRGVLEKNNLKINEFVSILDFGCGCGRMMRHWKTLKGPKLYGTDYNHVLVKWCKDNLPFATFTVNGLKSRLIYKDDTFDFIYAISVFTHLTEDMGFFWMKELDRVLKPGGVMYVTFMGTTRAPHLRQELRGMFEAGQLVVTGEEHTGKNICAAYHPEQYVSNILAKGFRVLDFVPGGARDANQDVFLLQKKA
jgi:2-polyprenyl-3-methyl-5-hydroxy-6-metoxy-1,4-benzoquinol methylase